MATVPIPVARFTFEQAIARWWRGALLAGAMALGLAERLTYGRGAPLWFDETFTGVIAGQASVAGLWHWLRTELTGPGYYVPMWLWAQVAGVSTAALRWPSLFCTLAAPMLVLWRGHRDPTLRLAWAAVLLLWMPAAALANDARPYALLVLLGTVQIAAFRALLAGPSRRTALRWTMVTAAIGLTHYLALLPGLVQGLILLVHQRRAVWRLWPATAAFVPLVGWMTLHLPYVLRLEQKGIPQTTTLTRYVLGELPPLVVGDATIALLLAGAIAWSLFGRLRAGERWRMSPDAWTALGGIAGFGALLALGLVVPGTALRYFLPTIPGLLFAASWWLAGALRRSEAAAAAFLLAAMVGTLGLSISGARDTSLDQRHAFGVDLPSRWLAERPVRHVLFFWSDSSADLAADVDANLTEVGGFPLRRAGRPVTVETLHVPVGAPAARIVAARAVAGRADAILWVGNAPPADPRRSAAPLFADPHWSCRDFAQGLAVSVGCRRR